MVVVVPVVATIAHGRRPAATSSAIAAASASDLHRVLGVVRDQPHVLAAEAREQRRLFDRAVAVRRGVDDQRRGFGGETAAGEAVLGGSFARAEERDERARRGRVLNHPAPRARQAEHLAQPVGRDFLDLGERRTRLPRQAQHAEAGADVVAEHARQFAVRRKVAEEHRVRPVRESGHDHGVEIAKHRVERLRPIGWRRRQLPPNFARRRLRHHRPARHIRAIVGDPVDQLVAAFAEFVRSHTSGAMSLSYDMKVMKPIKLMKKTLGLVFS